MLESTVIGSALAAVGPSCLHRAWASGHKLLRALLPKSPALPPLSIQSRPFFSGTQVAVGTVNSEFSFSWPQKAPKGRPRLKICFVCAQRQG